MHTLEAIAGIALITFIGVVWVALILAADSERHEAEEFGRYDWRDTLHDDAALQPVRNTRNNLAGVIVPFRGAK